MNLMDEFLKPEAWEVLNPVAKETIIQEKPELSFQQFINKFLRHYFYEPGCKMHDDIIDLAQNKNERSVVIVAPRGFAKSTLVSFAFPLWQICEQLSKFIVIVSDTSSQAQGFLRDIVSELEENEAIQEYYGDAIFPKIDPYKNFVKWTDTDIITKSDIEVMAKGADVKLRGLRKKQYRPDLIIVDDLENDLNVQTLDQRKKLMNWFNKALLNTLDPDGGRVFVIGTILHHDALIKNLFKNKTYTTRFYRAIKDDGSPLWPARWSISKLSEKKKQIGSVAFNQEFMNNPINPEAKVFKEDWLQYYKVSEISKVMDELYARGEKLTIYGAVDPAISQSSKADYFSFVTIGITKNKDIYVLEAFKDRINFTSQIRTIISKAEKWNHSQIAIEENGYQQSLKEQLLSQSLLKIKPIKNFKDKYTRIIGMSTYFENGKIYITENMQNLIEELLFYPDTAHDDLLDALEMAISFCDKNSDIDFRVFRCFESEQIKKVW
ncbi:MAG TPA: phage terminase large subunit [Candidatus Eremiobacteraeota bacterium]|nr:phage terminase large subunit [Candidatus Eremiobacteraeota bacterium]